MADDTLQTGTDTISTDHVSTLNGAAVTIGPTTPKVQRVKVAFGDDNTSRDASQAFPLPVMSPDDAATGTITATDAVVAAPGGAGALVSGTPTAGSFVPLRLPGGESAWTVQATGAFGAGTVWFECSIDSTNGTDGSWSTLSLRTLGTNLTVTQDGTLVAGMFRGNAGSMAWVRARMTGATTPSVAVVMRASNADGPLAMNAPLPGGTNRIGEVGLRPADRADEVTSAAGVAVTLTLAAPAAGQFHYITGIYLRLYSTAARTGAAAPIAVTTTNVPGARQFLFGTAAAIGVVDRVPVEATSPIKSSAAATATTFVAPAVAGGLWRLTATYYTAV